MKNIISLIKVLPLALIAVLVSCKEDDDVEIIEVVDTLPQTGVENGYGYVDLGLPSNTMWATHNIGAYKLEKNAAGSVIYDTTYVNNKVVKTPHKLYSADLHGEYFAWGEVTSYGNEVDAYSSNWKGKKNSLYVQLYDEKKPKTLYLPDYYKWGGSTNILLKYNFRDEPGAQDKIDHLENEDDAAIQNWGGKWRMPTKEDAKELIQNCYWVYYHNYNGTKRQGYVIFRAKSEADKGVVVLPGQRKNPEYTLKDAHIFVRYSGFKRNNSSWNLGREGTLWTSDLNSAISTASHCLFMTDSCVIVNNCDRFTGRPIRPVFK